MAIPEAKKLSTEQKAHLHEIADLMTTIYETLVEMRYMTKESIIHGPHNLDEPRKDYDGSDLESVRKQCEKLGLDQAVIYLYSIMPYIDEEEAGVQDFYQGGAFFSQMKHGDVEQGRDPCYASPEGDYEDEGGPYMLPWYTPLSDCGNHSSIMIYDAREHRIWLVDQIDRRTTDPFLNKAWYEKYTEEGKKKEESTWGDSGDESNWSDDDLQDENEDEDEEASDAASNGSSEFWPDEDELNTTGELSGLEADRVEEEEVDFDEGFDMVEEPSEYEMRQASNIKNENGLELVRHRFASDFLRDVNSYYRELKEVPGQGEYTHGLWMSPKILKPLYQKHGWPDNFNGEQFQIDQARAYSAEQAKFRAEGPLQKVHCFESWAEHSDRDIERAQKEITDAKDLQAEWLARFKLWQAEERRDRNNNDLRKAREKAAEMCPDGKCQRDEDLPLWEAEMMRVEVQWKHEALPKDDSWKELYKGKEHQIPHIEARNRFNAREAAIYDKAFAESKADAERLCPGRTFQDLTGMKSLGREDTVTQIEKAKKSLEYPQRLIQQLKNFASGVPTEATEAQKAVEKEIEKMEDWIKNIHADIERKEKWLAEHGNTD